MLFTHLRVVTVHFTALKGHGNAIIASPFCTASTALFRDRIHIATTSVFAFKAGVATTAHIDNSSAVFRIAARTACNGIKVIVVKLATLGVKLCKVCSRFISGYIYSF